MSFPNTPGSSGTAAGLTAAGLPRTPEAEVMDAPEEAAAYDRMDHAAVNRAFVDDLLAALKATDLGERLRDGLDPLRLLDVGTGTALIPIELGRRPIFARMMLTDASEPMLARARKNVFASGLQGGTKLREARAEALPFEDGEFHAVVSNSLLHHLSDPVGAFREMARVLRPGGLLFVRDLTRPGTKRAADELVDVHTDGDAVGRALFRDSLHAAYTLDELEGLLTEAGLTAVRVEKTSDRHVTLCGTPGAAAE